MRKTKFYVLTVLISMSSVLNIYAQQREIFTLNTIDNEFTQKAKQSEGGKIFFDLNEEAFAHPEFKAGAGFEFYTGEGEPVQFVITKSIEYLPGTVSIIASKKRQDGSVFAATFANGRLNGIYHESHDEAVKIGFETGKNRQYLSKNKEHFGEQLACGVHDADKTFTTFSIEKNKKEQRRAKTSKSGFEYSPAPINASVDDSITIDLMLVYTDAAATWASTSPMGNIDAVIAQAMTRSQTALDNSNSGIELRLVYAHNTDYDEENDDIGSGERLRRLTQNPNNPVFDSEDGYDGFMEEVHDLRLQYGADVVSMIAKIDDVGGLGWRLASTGGSPHMAFNLNRVQQIAGGHTLIHEIGHNMGNSHSRTQKSSPANGSGGLFHYSAGYQNETSNFHTIMAYDSTANNVRLPEVPLFSSPNLSWLGVPAGTNNSETPEDNALSMRQIKRTVAGYLPTIENAPVANISDNEIAVTMNREDEFTTNFDITNSGGSNLVWDVDFTFPGNTVGKQNAAKKNTANRIKAVELENQIRQSANYSVLPVMNKSSQQEQVIYSTSFESHEGFNAGNFRAISDWRALTNSEFMISTLSPNSGSSHFRLEQDGAKDGDGEPAIQFMSAPFFGYQPFGEYEVTINFEIGGPGFMNEVFDFYLFDGKTDERSGGVILANSENGYTIYAADLDEEGQVQFFGTGANVPGSQYHALRIRYNVSEEQVEYYLNGSRIYTASYLYGNTPGEMLVLHRNSVGGTYLHVDDVEIRQLNAPYPWLIAKDKSGVTFDSQNSSVNITFNTKGISADTYETLMTVTTNDPDNRVFEIPVTLNVNDAVSNEIENTPGKISLEQNYPNPFNPSTVISYQLAEHSEVRLEVFNMQGQKVTTLQRGRQSAGEHKVEFDASNLASGIYIYRLQTAGQTLTRKMVLIK